MWPPVVGWPAGCCDLWPAAHDSGPATDATDDARGVPRSDRRVGTGARRPSPSLLSLPLPWFCPRLPQGAWGHHKLAGDVWQDPGTRVCALRPPRTRLPASLHYKLLLPYTRVYARCTLVLQLAVKMGRIELPGHVRREVSIVVYAILQQLSFPV